MPVLFTGAKWARLVDDARMFSNRRRPSVLSLLPAALVVLAIGGLAAPAVSSAELQPELAHELNPGPSGSRPNSLTLHQGYIYFAANDGAHGNELWRTNGAAAELVADIRPGPGSGSPWSMYSVGSYLFFLADDGVHGREIWRTDGVTTQLLADIDSAPSSSLDSFTQAAVVGGRLYFAADDGVSGVEPWWTDGTTTERLHDVWPGAEGSYPTGFAGLGGHVYFGAEDGGHGVELWRSDGTTTALFGDLSGSSSTPRALTRIGSRVYFSAVGTGAGREPWYTDGSMTDSIEVVPGSGASNPRDFIAHAGQVYFQATTETQGTELWRTDGTSATIVKDIAAGAGYSYPSYLTSFGPHLYFAAEDGVHGGQLWRTDGTTTEMVTNPASSPEGLYPGLLTVFGDQLIFGGEVPARGHELHSFKQGAGVSLLAEILPGTDDGLSGEEMVELNGALYFAGDDGTRGRELWRLRDVAPTPPAPPPPGPTTKDAKLRVAVMGRRVSLDRKGRIRVKLACRPAKAGGRCKGVLRLRSQAKLTVRRGKPKRRLTFAKRRFNIPAGKVRTVTVKLPRKAARLVRTQRQARRVVAMAKLPGQKVARKSLKLLPVPARR